MQRVRRKEYLDFRVLLGAQETVEHQWTKLDLRYTSYESFLRAFVQRRAYVVRGNALSLIEKAAAGVTKILTNYNTDTSNRKSRLVTLFTQRQKQCEALVRQLRERYDEQFRREQRGFFFVLAVDSVEVRSRAANQDALALAVALYEPLLYEHELMRQQQQQNVEGEWDDDDDATLESLENQIERHIALAGEHATLYRLIWSLRTLQMTQYDALVEILRSPQPIDWVALERRVEAITADQVKQKQLQKMRLHERRDQLDRQRPLAREERDVIDLELRLEQLNLLL